MKRAPFLFSFTLFIFNSVLAACASAEALEKAESEIRALIESGSILGAQFVVGDAKTVLLERNYGVRSVSDQTPVDSETRFCIGSCSKPFASALLMTLFQDSTLSLDKPVDHWLPEFGSLKTGSGEPVRAPTLRELLAHRGGIYSQKRKLTLRQQHWIRDFNLTLDEAVKGIATEPLLAAPGESYAYSGAGYCVIGRVLEKVAGKSFESLFQERLGVPLGLWHTTYFPDPTEPDIATGSVSGKPNPATPHLSHPFNLPLVGGSLYSTAGDCAGFLKMILNQGKLENQILLNPATFDEYTGKHFEGQAYGLGWTLRIKHGKTIGLSHSGSLASSRALFMVNLEKGLFGTVLYTLSDPDSSANVSRSLTQVLSSVVIASPL